MKKTLKELRNEHGLTQQQLADELGVNVRTVQGWESGKRPISRNNKKFVALYFGIPEDELDTATYKQMESKDVAKLFSSDSGATILFAKTQTGEANRPSAFLSDYVDFLKENQKDIKVTIVDPYCGEFYDFVKENKDIVDDYYVPKIDKNTTRLQSLETLLDVTNEKLEDVLKMTLDREKELSKDKNVDFPHYLLMIDEVKILLSTDNDEKQKKFFHLIKQISKLGKETNIHLILDSGKVSESFIEEVFPVREALNVLP